MAGPTPTRLTMAKKIAFLTAGGLAPCLSSSIGGLIEKYNELAPDAELIGYLNGYQGLLLGKSMTFPPSVKERASVLYQFGGSPIGNSRVKLTNVADCEKRGLVQPGEEPLRVAAEQLKKDGIDILHTIGGDDTNTTAADLAAYLHENGYDLTVVGMPKTVDNDVIPIKQTLGAWTAAEQGAIFFENIANENTTSTRHLIIHEVMGRHCGWLTAATAQAYRERLQGWEFFPEMQLAQDRWDVHAVWVPEMDLDSRCGGRAPHGAHGPARCGEHLPERRRGNRCDRTRERKRPERKCLGMRSATPVSTS